MKSRSLVSANITCSGSIVFLSLTLVTRKHRYLPGTCATDDGSAAVPPSPGLCLNRNSTFWYSLLKSASSLDLKLMSALMQIALVLSDRMKSLSVIRIFSEYSFGISNFVFEIPSYGRLGLLPFQFQSALFYHFSEFLYHQIFGVGKSYPHSPDKNIYRRPRR